MALNKETKLYILISLRLFFLKKKANNIIQLYLLLFWNNDLKKNRMT